jgi:formylglycine-generating enzyme required for sulfatase activity
VVLTAVLSAEVKEEKCSSIEGGAEAFGSGGELGMSQQCLEESSGHVAVAYKSRPVGELLGGAAAPAVVAGPTVGSGGRSGGAFDGVGDVAAQIRSAEAMKERLEGELAQCLEAESETVATAARADWGTLGELRALAAASAEARQAAAAQVERFVALYDGKEVACRNDLGERRRAVRVAEVAEARAWLAQPAAGGGQWVGQSGYRMVGIAAGTFTMGSPKSEKDRDDDETQHEVRLTRGFMLGETEVTQGLWRSVLGKNPSVAEYKGVSLVGDTLPVQNVDWCDAVGFANALSARDGLSAAYSGTERCAETKGESVRWERGSTGYRLPTESEWEYAARAGEHRLFAGADTEAGAGACAFANVGDAAAKSKFSDWTTFACSDGVAGLASVGSYGANGWGLHDMTGNVWEWCWDIYGDYPSGSASDPVGAQSGPYRVFRGGSWRAHPRAARVANRYRFTPDRRYYTLGLRLARTNP